MKIKIKVIPGASQESVEWFGAMLKVKVRTPPEKGRANAAVENLVATKLGLAKSAVHVVTGLTHSIKTLEIIGIDETDLRTRIV